MNVCSMLANTHLFICLAVAAVGDNMNSNYLLYNARNGFCYNSIIKSFLDVERRHCITLFFHFYEAGMEASAVLYDQNTR